MPEWLLILLLFLALAVVNYLAYRWGRANGYDAGYSDSTEVGRELDKIVRDVPSRSNHFPFHP